MNAGEDLPLILVADALHSVNTSESVSMGAVLKLLKKLFLRTG